MLTDVLVNEFKDFDVQAILGNHDFDECSQHDFSQKELNKALELSVNQIGDKVFYEKQAFEMYKRRGFAS